MKNFGVSAAFTYRKMVDFNWDPRTGVRSNNYQQVGTFTGSGLPDGRAPAAVLRRDRLAGGSRGARQRPRAVTHDGYSQRFIGFEASATKRLSNRWMARSRSRATSTRSSSTARRRSAIRRRPAAPLVNGGLVVVASGGSGKSGIYQVLPLYQFIATGMYQARWASTSGST